MTWQQMHTITSRDAARGLPPARKCSDPECFASYGRVRNVLPHDLGPPVA